MVSKILHPKAMILSCCLACEGAISKNSFLFQAPVSSIQWTIPVLFLKSPASRHSLRCVLRAPPSGALAHFPSPPPWSTDEPRRPSSFLASDLVNKGSQNDKGSLSLALVLISRQRSMLNEATRGRILVTCMRLQSASKWHSLVCSTNSEIKPRARRLACNHGGLTKRGNVVSFVGLCLQWLPLMGAIPSSHAARPAAAKAMPSMAFSLIPRLELPRSLGRHGVLSRTCRPASSPLTIRSLHNPGAITTQQGVFLAQPHRSAALGPYALSVQQHRKLSIRRAGQRDMTSPWAFLDPEDVPELSDGDGEQNCLRWMAGFIPFSSVSSSCM